MPPKAHILIIDDDANTLASLARAFRLAGHEATVCDNAARALELAKGDRFDLVLSDVVMPGKDGIALLEESDFVVLNPGAPNSPGNRALISAGTGLGEAGLYWDGQHYHPFATEGGHSDFAPRTAQDVELFYYLQKQFGHVSWERVVSGMGIKNIFHFLTESEQEQIPEWLSARFPDADPAAVISQAAMRHEDPVCTETMDLFVRYMATEAASLVLKLMATGGLYLAGGIPPKILPLLQSDNWSKNFDNNGRMHDLSDRVPIHVVLNDKMALQGAAYYGAFNM